MGRFADLLEQGSDSVQNTSGWMTEEEEQNYTPSPNLIINASDTRDISEIRQEQAGNFVAPEPDYIFDAYYSPSWFLEEQKNRENPEYVSPVKDYIDNEGVDAIANYIGAMKEQHPDDWKYGDPGWSADNPVWTEYVKPLEEQYRTAQRAQQVEQDIQEQSLDYRAEQALAKPGNTNLALANIDKSNQTNNSEDYSFVENVSRYALPSSAGTETSFAQKLTQPFLQSLASSGGVAKIAQTAALAVGSPLAGKIHGAVQFGMFGYNYGKAIGLVPELKPLEKLQELSDILDTKSQQVQGAFAYGFEKAGGGEIGNFGDIITNWKFVIDNFDTIMDYAFGEHKASSEYNPVVVGIVTGNTANMGANAIGFGNNISRTLLNIARGVFDEDSQYIKYGQVSRTNSSLPGVYDLPEELIGSNAIPFWLEYGQALYDGGITDPDELEYLINKAISEVYGDLSNLSEFVEHEVGDPANVVENLQTRAVGQYGKITGDVNLQSAANANTGSWAGDLTSSIPVIPDVIRTVGKLFGNNELLKQSGGIDEVMAQWDIENKSNPVSQLTDRDRRFSQIDKDGKIKDFNPNKDPSQATNKVSEILQRAWNLTQRTDETKASLEGDAIFDFIQVGIDDAIRARGDEDPQTTINRINEFVSELENPDNISEESPFYNMSQSAIFNTVKDDIAQAVKTRGDEIRKNIQAYVETSNNRAVLNTLSAELNISPSKLIDMYEDKKQRPTLTQMIVNKADEHGGKIPGIDIDVESSEFGEKVIQMIKPFTGDNPLAFDVRQLGVQVTGSIADGVTETLVRKYNIQPEPLLYRFGDTVKKTQHLLLLGLSPSYLANNFINNVVTRSALGVGGYLTSATIERWMEKFGFSPDRFAETFIGEMRGSDTGSMSDNLNKAIHNEKMKVEGGGLKKGLADFMQKVGQAGKDVSSKVGVFANLSEKVESNESKQIVASSMMTYMARTWKPGVNFRKMSVDLEQAIESQVPGMVSTIYSAVGAGMNMADIENAIFGSFVAPSVLDSMYQAASNLSLNRSRDIVEEYFVKGGMLAELNEALKGKRGDEIDKIVSEYAERLKREMEIQLSDDLTARAEAVKNQVGTETGFINACKLGMDMAAEMTDVWINSQQDNTKIFQQRIKEGMPVAEFHALYQEHQKQLNERWQNVYAVQQQTYLGILQGLGMGDKNRTAYLDAMHLNNNLWVDFYENKQPALFQPYLDALQWREDDTRATWESRTKDAYKTYLEKVQKEVQKTYDKQTKYQNTMDKAFADGLRESLPASKAGEVDSVIVPQLELIRNKRQEIIEQNKKIREISDKTDSLNEKNLAWAEAQDQLLTLKRELLTEQQKLFQHVQALSPYTTKPSSDSVTQNVDYAAQIRADVAEQEATAAQKSAAAYSEKASNTAETGRDSIFNATTPNRYAADLRRANVAEIAQMTGADKETARQFARYMENVADRWEAEHPGHDYYQDNFGVRMEYVTVDQQKELAANQFKGSIVEGEEGSYGFSAPISDVEEGNINNSVYVSSDDSTVTNTVADNVAAPNMTAEQVTESLQQGKFVPLSEADLTNIPQAESRDATVERLARQLHEAELRDETYAGEHHTVDDYVRFIYQSVDEKGNLVLGEKERGEMAVAVAFVESEIPGLKQEMDMLRQGMRYTGKIPQSGTYVAQTYSFEHGQYAIVGAVFKDGDIVSYVPSVMPITEVDYDGNGTMLQVIGVSPANPDKLVYMVGDDVHTQSTREDTGSNPWQGEMPMNSMPDIDPVAQAHNQMGYEEILPILNEFVRVYKQNLENNAENSKVSSLREDTREQLRKYIDYDVRQDLNNTKYKATKFGTMMRDAALLNYNDRRGFDNFLTFLSPYQFWNSRSMIRWMERSGSKGKLWRDYEKLEELKRRNKREFMPSKTSGKVGLYIPGLPDWMGDSIFMPLDQLLVVNQFVEPLIDSIDNKNAVIATAEQFIREQFENDQIDYQQYKLAMDASTRDKSQEWQVALAKAQQTEGNDNDFGSLFQDYFGLSLPLSVLNAVRSGDKSAWSQWPITRLGTAMRSAIGDNFAGQAVEGILSAPEWTVRTAVSKATGNDDFAYNEFGSFGDYYIRNQVYDMMMEGRISPEDALQATIEKDSNKIWQEAAGRQREETLVKMQGGMVIDAAKKLFNQGDSEDSVKDNWLYLLAAIATAPFSKQVVREGEREWREERGEQSKAYEAKGNGDANAVNDFNAQYPNYRYNSLRWEEDPEQALRKYSYNSILQNYYALDKADQETIRMSFGNDFQTYVLNKDTRAIESMPLEKLVGYAQALNGAVPYLATDKLNTKDIVQPNIMPIAQPVKDAYTTYYETREKLYPGMSKVESLYYALPANERKIFKDANPKLGEYQQWRSQYKKDNPNVSLFTDLQTDYYAMVKAENVCSNLDPLTIKEISYSAYTGTKPDKAYQPLIEYAMQQAGVTDSYDKFLETLQKYVMGE